MFGTDVRARAPDVEGEAPQRPGQGVGGESGLKSLPARTTLRAFRCLRRAATESEPARRSRARRPWWTCSSPALARTALASADTGARQLLQPANPLELPEAPRPARRSGPDASADAGSGQTSVRCRRWRRRSVADRRDACRWTAAPRRRRPARSRSAARGRARAENGHFTLQTASCINAG